MRGATREYGPVVFCALVVIAALLADGCGGQTPREDLTPQERADRAIYVSKQFLIASSQTVNAAYDSGLCDENPKACRAADDAIVSAIEAINAAEAQVAGWSGRDEPIPCIVDSLAHVAEALRDIDGVRVPDGFEPALELLIAFQDQCFASVSYESRWRSA